VGTFLSVIATCIAAYPLSRKDLPHRSFFMFVILFTMLFGGVA
jgi:putative aldouronate transport system permease protein